MSAYFSFFDELFFFGSLKGCCELSIDEQDTIQARHVTGLEVNPVNKVLGLLDTREGEKCVILSRSQPNQFEGRHEKLKAYVEKMLHFMIHAFLELWTCERVACRKGFEKLGKTGHGRAWQDVAVAVENAVREEGFLNLDLKLDREKGLALELL